MLSWRLKKEYKHVNKSTACGCKRSDVGSLVEDKKPKSKKERNSEQKNAFELSPLIVWIALWIVNTNSEFQVNIFSNNTEILQVSKKVEVEKGI